MHRADDVLLTLEQKVDPRHTAVVVVDVQNDFCAPGGYYDRTGARLPGIQEMVPRLQAFVAAARDAYMHDYYVVVLADCTAARDDAFHRGALANVEGSFGVGSAPPRTSARSGAPRLPADRLLAAARGPGLHPR